MWIRARRSQRLVSMVTRNRDRAQPRRYQSAAIIDLGRKREPVAAP